MRAGPTSELADDAQVAVPERTDVGDAVAQLGDALEAPAECEPGDLLGVVAHEAQHVLVHHPRAADLDPSLVRADAAALAVAYEAEDVRLHRRLGEGEEAR